MLNLMALQDYLHSAPFLEALGLPNGTELTLSPLGQGEYNYNCLFVHPHTGQKLVLRVNTGSQMHLEHQIAYEYHALAELAPSGRTPRPLFYDDSRSVLPWGVLVMEWLPGRPLRYETDLAAAGEILADIHSLPLSPQSRLLCPCRPARSILDECLAMAGQYLSWEGADPECCRLLEGLIRLVDGLPLTLPSPDPRCRTNTELNSGNFLINPGGQSYLVDWEKPLISEPAQDLAHFLAPTTTLWKTDTLLTEEEMNHFLSLYERAVDGRLGLAHLRQRLPLFLAATCLRGVSWCAMALREYSRPGRPLVNQDTFVKIQSYLTPDFLRYLLDRCSAAGTSL